MQSTSPIIPVFALTVLAGNCLNAEDYFTKDGKLTQQLKIVQQQGGFAGFTGVQFTISPDGSWTSDSIFNQKITPKKKGKLTEKDLAKLGAILQEYDLIKLPMKSGKQPGANPHTITFEFGNKKASLVGQMPPKLDPKNPRGSVESRFAGIWEGVVDLLTPPPLPKEQKKIERIEFDCSTGIAPVARKLRTNERERTWLHQPGVAFGISGT